MTRQGDAAAYRGDLRSAIACFQALLDRMEQQPAGTACGPGSAQHSQTLHQLARCLEASGQPGAAEQTLRRAMAASAPLLAARPENEIILHRRGELLIDLGDVLTDQGQYAAAHAAYVQTEQLAQEQGETRQQATALGQRGTLVQLPGRNPSFREQLYHTGRQSNCRDFSRDVY